MAAIGFTNTNKGIGYLEAADGRFLYEIIDADPTSATYGVVTNAQLEGSGAMPAAGYYVAGAFVKNTSAAGAGIAGWLRLTNGSGHVLNTDWAVAYTAAALPEPSKALGYTAGAGGAVTQATSKSTGVTLNRPAGAITMNGVALAAGTIVSFALTNSVITADDVLTCATTRPDGCRRPLLFNLLSCRARSHKSEFVDLSPKPAKRFQLLPFAVAGFAAVPAKAQETFHGYDCTDDCSGHEAGFDWAARNDVTDEGDCNADASRSTRVARRTSKSRRTTQIGTANPTTKMTTRTATNSPRRA
jgi:hypothetical protein